MGARAFHRVMFFIANDVFILQMLFARCIPTTYASRTFGSPFFVTSFLNGKVLEGFLKELSLRKISHGNFLSKFLCRETNLDRHRRAS